MKTQKNHLFKSIITAFLVLITAVSFGQYSSAPTISKTFKLSEPGKLYARSSGGGIHVEASNKQEVTIHAFVRKNGKTLSADDPRLEEILDNFNIQFEQKGSVVNAIVERKVNFSFLNNIGISLAILVPQEISCKVSSSGGGVDVAGVEGTHNISSSGGGIHLEKVSGVIEASSSGGGIHANRLSGEIQISSSGGGVTIEDARGNITTHSSGGGIRLSEINGSADASSSGGGVTVSGEFQKLKAKSSGGSVRVDLRKLSEELYLQSSGGGVDLSIQNGDELGMDLDLRAGKVNVNLHNFSGTAEKDRVNGSMNGGGIPVYVHASGGNVNVHF